MRLGIEQIEMERAAARTTRRRVIYWMALFTTVLGGLYLAGLLGKLLVNGSVHAVSSQGVQTVSAVVALLWNVGLLILFASMRRQVTRQHRLFAELVVIFMTLVCATSSISWFIQLAIVPRLGTGTTGQLMALLDMHNELSITYAMEHLGWGLFYGLAVIFAAAATGAGKLEAWIRWLLVAGGALSLLHLAGIIVGSSWLGDLGYVAWGVLLPAATALLAVRSKSEL